MFSQLLRYSHAYSEERSVNSDTSVCLYRESAVAHLGARADVDVPLVASAGPPDNDKGIGRACVRHVSTCVSLSADSLEC